MALTSMTDRTTDSAGARSDLRSFDVRDRNGTHLGEVHDVLVDGDHTRFLCIRIDDRDRHVLVPSGYAEADHSSRTVTLPAVAADRLVDLPEYRHDVQSIDERYARSLTTSLDEGSAASPRSAHPAHRDTHWKGSTDERSLERVDRLDHIDVADHDPDPRGWPVVGGDGIELGRVVHLLGDATAMKVRYLVVESHRDVADDDRRFLVPTGYVDLDTEREQVVAAGLTLALAKEQPAYEHDRFDADFERRVLSAHSWSTTGVGSFYDDPRFRDDRLYGRASTTHI